VKRPDGSYVSWSDFFLWRDEVSRAWGRSVLVIMHATFAGKGLYADQWSVYATKLGCRMPADDDPVIRCVWPNSRWQSVPAMLIWAVIELDRLMLEREAESRAQAAF
jgi:hypothetical protein